ncbi:MAG TPA: glycosyltransferase family 39 protein [Chitinophaga sp.]|uniref:ArnT family glycosyltransferase n=1 Tax=Chitinophaga sp. TaxID=1869181 RepID=UPI002DB8A9A7|nr:glycosyltransferase family 39 protein [Chitinophaga sp.]HEU4554738.1 glycosyltransferase family 39 protein [Chitinophaga sp.]
MHSTALLLKRSLYNGFLIPVIHFILIAIIASRFHLLADCDATNHYFSGIDIFRGNGYNGWASHFWPPLFPVLIGLLAKVAPAFEAIKLISTVASALLLLVVYKYVLWLVGSRTAAWVAQLLTVTNFLFLQLSVQIENHMLDSLWYILAVFLLLRYLENGSWQKFLLAGIVCGLAGLTRYTSYALLPAFMIIMFFFYPFKRAAWYAGCILLGFAIVSAPWWIVNYRVNGSPFATWQYMNIGLGVFSNSETRWSWSWSGIDQFNSVADVFLYAPGKYIANFCYNVAKSMGLILYRGQLLGCFCIAALFVYSRLHYKSVVSWLRSSMFLPLGIIFVCYLVLVSQAFVFGEVYLSWYILLIIYGTFAGYKLWPLLYRLKPASKKALINLVLLAAFLDIGYAAWQLKGYLYNTRGIEENAQVMAALRQQDQDISDKILMCFHPARAYHLGTKFLMLPLYYTGDLNGLVTYQHMSRKVREQASRFPCTMDVNHVKADYLVYDPLAMLCLPQFSFLLHAGDPRIPRNFQLVYLSAKVAVYKIY